MGGKIRNRTDYDKRIRYRSVSNELSYYSKKKMRSIYPNRNYQVIGEIANMTGIQSGNVENLDGQPLPIYKDKSHAFLSEAVDGYVAIDDHLYLAVIKNKLISRLILLTLIFGSVLAYLLFCFYSA